MDSTEKLIERIAQQAVPVKPAIHPFALSAKWLAAMMAYLMATVILSGVRPDLSAKLDSPLWVAELVLLAAIVVSACLSAALLSFPDMHQKRWLAFTPAVIGVLFMLVLGLAWQADNPPAPHAGHTLQCTLKIALLALLPAAFMFYSMRGFASTHPYLAGGIALLAAFSIGSISLRLYESTDSMLHVIQWHYLPMTGAGLIGLGLGKIFLKW